MSTTSVTIIIFVIGSLLCVSYGASEALAGVTWKRFSKCPRGVVPPGGSLYRQLSGRSVLDCVQMCSHTPLCAGVAVCPIHLISGEMTCTMTQGPVAEDVCSNPPDLGSSACYYVYKNDQPPQATTTAQPTSTTSTETTAATLPWCGNGVVDNGNCKCPTKMNGHVCERYFRDCSEMVDRSVTGPEEDAYWIQPVGAPRPFKVRCQFRWGGTTALIRRDTDSTFDQPYAVLKRDGIGNDPTVYNYFVGLDNLHYFTTQASYELNFHTDILQTTLYLNFTFGPESTSYEINYSQFESASKTIDNFASSSPMKLSAGGHENNECYTKNSNKTGWYRADCSGLPIFNNGDLPWENPRNKFNNIQELNVKFVRKSAGYYVN